MGTLTSDPLGLVAVGSAAIAAAILIVYLVRRPPLTNFTRFVLLLGIGAFPLITAGAGNLHGYNATKTRRFCGSCHVMTPYAEDSENLASTSLASRHARNGEFGEDNCYYCHADYGMFGTITTKIGGMRHVYEYLFNYRNMSLEEARKEIHLRGRFKNSNCMQCHSTELAAWQAIDGHKGALPEIRSGETSCASVGCHGPAHPFSKDLPPEVPAAPVPAKITPDAGMIPFDAAPADAGVPDAQSGKPAKPAKPPVHR
jgi:cytochrome c-type protein NapC